jgi:DNA-binding beta-propeller fold protein YncE
MRNILLLLTATLLGLVLSLGAQTGAPTLRKVASFDLPGPGGKRFDYLTIDNDDNYLLSAHLAAGQTYVIDLATNKIVATVTDTSGAEGIEYVPELRKFYTSNANDSTIGVVDLKQMKVIKKLKTEAKPDGSAYAAPFHKLYVSDERGKAEAVVDVKRDEIIRTLHFDSENRDATVRPCRAEGILQPAGPECLRGDRSCDRRNRRTILRGTLQRQSRDGT